jgi:hypothetical protein
MLDLKLLLMYTRVFRLRLIVTIVSCVIIQVFIYCMLVHQLYKPMTGHWFAPATPTPTAIGSQAVAGTVKD